MDAIYVESVCIKISFYVVLGLKIHPTHTC